MRICFPVTLTLHWGCMVRENRHANAQEPFGHMTGTQFLMRILQILLVRYFKKNHDVCG